MSSLRFSFAFAVGLVAVSGASLSAQTFTRLGNLSAEWQNITPTGVSSNGVVAGWGVRSGMISEAFRWSRSDGIVGLGALPGGDSVGSLATAISADGRVIVGGSSAAGLRQAFRWTAEEGLRGLGNLPEGPPPGMQMLHPGSTASAVSADGSTVVGYSRLRNGMQPIRWTSDTGLQGLGYFTPGVLRTQGNGVSGDGAVVVGNGGIGENDAEAYRWTANEGMVGLGFLPGGISYSDALAVSVDGGTIVGFSASVNGNNEAYRWTPDGGMTGLGFLPGGDQSTATGVSADGSIIVGTSGSPLGLEGFEAFFWTPGAGMRGLVEVLANDYGLAHSLEGWNLFDARISPNGRYLIGGGFNPNGISESWLVDLRFTPVPEPSTYGAGALLILSLAAWRKCRSRSVLPRRLRPSFCFHRCEIVTSLMSSGADGEKS